MKDGLVASLCSDCLMRDSCALGLEGSIDSSSGSQMRKFGIWLGTTWKTKSIRTIGHYTPK